MLQENVIIFIAIQKMSIIRVKIASAKQEKMPTNLLRTNGDVSERFRLQLVEGHA